MHFAPLATLTCPGVSPHPMIDLAQSSPASSFAPYSGICVDDLSPRVCTPASEARYGRNSENSSVANSPLWSCTENHRAQPEGVVRGPFVSKFEPFRER